MKTSFHRTALLAAVLSAVAFAQSPGRTDGPEGSEVGTGGYRGQGVGKFSLAADFGGSVSLLGGSTGVPLYVGLTPSFWVADWFVLDLFGGYSFNSRTLNVLVGPRLRTPTWPLSGFLGLRAGPAFTPAGVRFSVSPIVGADLVAMKHLLAGLHLSCDLPIGGPGIDLRIGLNLGWRF